MGEPSYICDMRLMGQDNNKGFTLQKLIGRIRRQRTKILEEFAMAYLADIGLRPSQVVMVEERRSDNVVAWYFEEKKKRK